MFAAGCVWNRISDIFGTWMLPINCTGTANEDVIISALEWELCRSLHNIALQQRLSELTIVEVLCDYELHRTATHGVHICYKLFFPFGCNADELSTQYYGCIFSFHICHLWTCYNSHAICKCFKPAWTRHLGWYYQRHWHGPMLSGRLLSDIMLFREVFLS